jgi:RNA polymerase primary sigma factor
MQRPLLVQDEERELARKARNGDELARRRLVESNMRLVCNIARNYQKSTIPMEDLVQEGAIGLINAIEKFDPDKGFRFSTYAIHWIKQSIGKALVNRSRVIRIPAHVSDGRRRVERFQETFECDHGRPPTPEEEALGLGFSSEKLSYIRTSEQDCCSLDSGREEHWDYTTVLPDEACEDPLDAAMRNVDREEFRRLVAQLPEKERTVIRMRLGLDDAPPMQCLELAGRMNLSRERVRLIEAKAIRSLRRMVIEQEADEFDSGVL